MISAHWWIVALALLAAGAFVVVALQSERRARATAIEYSSLPFLEGALGRAFPWMTLFVALWALAIVAFGLALAKPSIVANVPVHDGSVVLCIDTSGSMASTDVLPTRSEASRIAGRTFIDGVPEGTRVGIVAFSTAAFPLGPLTDDRDVARDELARLPAPNGGTAIGDALATAARMLPPTGRRAIVLMTDGVNNHGIDPSGAASEIGASGIAIFTVGIGTNDSGQLIPGTAESASIDEDALRDIARSGNGTYARVADADALRRRLGTLAQTSIRERRRIDLTLTAAIGGGVLAIGTVLGALLVGRFP